VTRSPTGYTSATDCEFDARAICGTSSSSTYCVPTTEVE
jgi:hypothetical protein